MNFQKPKGQEEDISVTSLQLENGLFFLNGIFFFSPRKAVEKSTTVLLNYFVAPVFPCIEQ